MFKINGKKWKIYSSHFPLRPDIDIKNQFFSIVRKNLRHLCRFTKLSLLSSGLQRIKPNALCQFVNLKLDADITKDTSSNILEKPSSNLTILDLMIKTSRHERFNEFSDLSADYIPNIKRYINSLFELK